MFRSKSCRCLQFNNKNVIDIQINKVFTNTKTIFIIHIQRFLSLHLVTSLLKPMLKRCLIDLLKQPRTKILMHAIGNLTYF